MILLKLFEKIESRYFLNKKIKHNKELISKLTDHELRDIGIPRHEIDAKVEKAAIDALRHLGF
jgi:hypothetical protein